MNHLPRFVYNHLPRFVHIVEDGFEAVFADAGAVLDVAGALEVGKGRLHAASQLRDLFFDAFEDGGVEDHILLVVVLPDFP